MAETPRTGRPGRKSAAKRSTKTPAKRAASKKTAAKKTATRKRPAKKAAAKKIAAGPAVAPPTAVLELADSSNVSTLPERPRPLHPEGLGPQGRALWDQVVEEFDLGATELCILADACLERDLLDRLRNDLIGSASMVKGSMGQMVANPLITELRQHRLAFAQLVGKLKLPLDEDPGSASGSALGRALVNQRWRSS